MTEHVYVIIRYLYMQNIICFQASRVLQHVVVSCVAGKRMYRVGIWFQGGVFLCAYVCVYAYGYICACVYCFWVCAFVRTCVVCL